jgi:hypothetical protein
VGTFPINLKLTDPQGASKKYSFNVIVMETTVANDTQVNKEEQGVLSNDQLLAALESTPEWNWLD